MKRITKAFIALLFFIIVLELVVLAPSDLDVAPTDAVSQSDTDVAASSQFEQSMRGVHLVEARNEKREWELWADTAHGTKKHETWNLDNVKAVFFASDGVSFNVTGDKGVVEVGSKNMMVKGNVVTRSSNGYVFKTDEIQYDSHERRLRSPSAVQMVGPRDARGDSLRLTGDEMQTNLADAVMLVNNNVKGKKRFKGNKRLTITSHSSEFSGNSHSARFLGNVVMDVNTMRITGPEANFKYDPKQGAVTDVLVAGGVKVSDVDKWATSEQVNVQFDKDKFVFQGKPRLVQNNDELRGDKIIFTDGGKRVQVLKARAKVEKKRLETVH